MTTKTFRDLGVDEPLCAALEDQGIIEPFAIQELTVPLALDRSDVIGQARTGTGKTLAFGLPVLQHVEHGGRNVQALIVTPTRELTLQVAEDLKRAGKRVDARVQTIYGGVPIGPQTETLNADRSDIVVGTPGRLLDHVGRGNLDLSNVRVLVLDEADEMLDMGFLGDVEKLIAQCGEDRQTLLFSATMPGEVVTLARKYMRHPTFIRAEVEEPQVAPETQQHFFLVHRMDKPRVLARILQAPGTGLATVFVRTKRMADRLVEELRELKIDATAVHGDLRQERRERNLDRFRDGKADVLVATEVAARGLDIEGVTHVVNYDCPEDEKMYLHRIGRTGRAGAAGIAVTFATFAEVDRLNAIRKRVGAAGQPIEEVFSTSERLTELFDLPGRTPWDRFSGDEAPSGDGAPSGEGGRKTDDRPARGKATRPRSEPKGQRGGRSRSSTRAERSGAPARGPKSGAAARDPNSDAPGRSDRTAKAASNGTTPDSSGRDRERTRSRDRSRPSSASGGNGSTDETAARDAAREVVAPDDDPERTRVRRRERPAPKEQESRQRSSDRSLSDDGHQRSRDGKGDTGRGQSGRGGRRRGGKGRGSGRGGGEGRGSGDRERGGREADAPVFVPEKVEAGKGARGEGRPTLQRRVKVEHLP